MDGIREAIAKTWARATPVASSKPNRKTETLMQGNVGSPRNQATSLFEVGVGEKVCTALKMNPMKNQDH
jgi:hypothetical protein